MEHLRYKGFGKNRWLSRNSPAGEDPLKQHLNFWMTPPMSAQPIRSYQVEMTKKLHVVIVSNDFVPSFIFIPSFVQLVI